MKDEDKTKKQLINEKYKIALMAILLAGACLLTYYFHGRLGIGTVFTHSFYIPIIVASFWWKRKGLAVAIFLAALLIFSHIFFRVGVLSINDYLRGIMFIVVALAVSTLSERTAKAEQVLNASEGRYRQLYDEAPVGYHEIDREGNIVRVNETEAKLLGYTVGEMRGKPVWEFVAPDQRELSRRAVEEKIEKRRPLAPEGFERKCITKDGRQIDVYIVDRLIFDKEGRVTGIRSTVQDIRQRKKAEEKLKETLAELERSNVDLEQFAYAASHDLQEPLRMVSSYVQLLAKRYQGKLDSDADDFIEYVVDGASRMQGMINDLLVYSRVGRLEEPLKPVDCQAVLEQVLANLEAAIEESGAVVTHDTLPEVSADTSQLVQLFQNLIGNAVRFRSDEPLQVHIGAGRKDDQWLFWVRDNGIGIDPHYAERIFTIFQRLHPRSEYPGTGIGLAICKRIVEGHGGRIWVDSRLGKGATFYFTIPTEAGDNDDHGSNK